MTDNTPHSGGEPWQGEPQDVYALARRINDFQKQPLPPPPPGQQWPAPPEAAIELAAEVVRLHDALALVQQGMMTWRDELRRQVAVDERDLDETWLEAGEVVEMLTKILSDLPMEADSPTAADVL